MSAGDVAAVIVAGAVCIGVVGLLFALSSLVRTLTVMRRTFDDVRAEAVPLLSDLRSATQKANDDLERVDTLLNRAQSISGTVDSASRLAYAAFSNPLVKILSLSTGLGRGAHRLWRSRRS